MHAHAHKAKHNFSPASWNLQKYGGIADISISHRLTFPISLSPLSNICSVLFNFLDKRKLTNICASVALEKIYGTTVVCTSYRTLRDQKIKKLERVLLCSYTRESEIFFGLCFLSCFERNSCTVLWTSSEKLMIALCVCWRKKRRRKTLCSGDVESYYIVVVVILICMYKFHKKQVDKGIFGSARVFSLRAAKKETSKKWRQSVLKDSKRS